ncbi:hypothetical protein MJO29_000408 [Puccinia striiformis f. sp. tritici]|nr:hypothetical protein MJO29_000408 [Puccinia striiformis f. sp. tritici]
MIGGPSRLLLDSWSVIRPSESSSDPQDFRLGLLILTRPPRSSHDHWDHHKIPRTIARQTPDCRHLAITTLSLRLSPTWPPLSSPLDHHLIFIATAPLLPPSIRDTLLAAISIHPPELR